MNTKPNSIGPDDASSKSSDDLESLKSELALREGVEMTLQQLRQLLRQHSVESEESLGQPFDPQRHEALSTRRDPTRLDHTIFEVFQRGYRHEVFRPAKVVVNNLSRLKRAASKNLIPKRSYETFFVTTLRRSSTFFCDED